MSAGLYVFLSMPLTGRGVAYSCGSLSEELVNHELSVTIIVPRATARLVPSVRVVEVLPKWSQLLPYRWVRDFASGQIEHAFLSQMARQRSQTMAAYIWSNLSVAAIRKLRHDGITVFREMSIAI